MCISLCLNDNISIKHGEDMERIIENLVDVMIERDIIDSKYKDEYIYSAICLIEKLFSVVLVLAMGLFFKRMLDVVLFFSFFMFLRKYTGGYHANSFFICTIESTMVVYCVLKYGYLLLDYPNIVIVMLISCFFIILLIGTVNHPNMNLNECELKRMKVRARLILISEILIIVVAYVMSVPKRYILDMILGITVCGISIMISKIIKQEVQSCERKRKQN